MLTTEQILLWAFIGGVLRIIIGFSKSYDLGMDYRKVFYTIIVSMVSGLVFSLLLNPDTFIVALIGGFAGSDGIDAIYRGIVRKKTGIAPASSFKLFSPIKEKKVPYPSFLNSRQKKGMDYVCNYGSISVSQYAAINKCSKNVAASDLNDIVKKRVIRKYGSGRFSVYGLK